LPSQNINSTHLNHGTEAAAKEHLGLLHYGHARRKQTWSTVLAPPYTHYVYLLDGKRCFSSVSTQLCRRRGLAAFIIGSSGWLLLFPSNAIVLALHCTALHYACHCIALHRFALLCTCHWPSSVGSSCSSRAGFCESQIWNITSHPLFARTKDPAITVVYNARMVIPRLSSHGLSIYLSIYLSI